MVACRRAITTAVLAAGFLGCSGDPFGPPPERAGEPIQTDRVQYWSVPVGGSGSYRRYEFRLIAVFRNFDQDSVFVGRCFPESSGPMYGIIPAGPDPSEESAYNGAWGCVGHDQQFAVAPGASRVDTLVISGPNTWDQSGQVLGVLEGRFRLLYEVSPCRGDGVCAGSSAPAALSNAFDVKRR